MTRRVFVANRGEVAVRIIRACQELGFETVLGVSAADTTTLATKLADRTVVIGGPRSEQSYLNAQAVLHAAVAAGCDALHPGYGFLSEDPTFAQQCADENIRFIGPSPQALSALGDKMSARTMAQELGVPVSEGGWVRSDAEAVELIERIGTPALLKAAHGGGGKGMRLVTDPTAVVDQWRMAAAESEAAFGSPDVFIERYVSRARHIEVQVIGDTHGGRQILGLRDCSVQHRYQKVVEEAGPALVPAEQETILKQSALALAESLDYVGLATVEFLYDRDRREVSFLEVNPRLQVEHPVTEAVTGRDLVREQILVCLGEPIPGKETDTNGHAIECRITAQDPDRQLLPSPGRLQTWRPPRNGYVRLDSHMYEGYQFPPFYDALMGKLIVWGATRAEAISRTRTALSEWEITGFATNVPLLERILAHPDFVAGDITTGWLSEQLETGAL